MADDSDGRPTKDKPASRRKFLTYGKILFAGSVVIVAEGVAAITFREPISKERIEEIEQLVFGDEAVTLGRLDTLRDRPDIYKSLQSMAKKAGLDHVELYVRKSSKIDAHCMPIISLALGEYGNKVTISSELLKILNDREVIAVLGHELGHMAHKKKEAFRLMMPSAIPMIAGLTAGTIASTVASSIDQVTDKKRRVISRRNVLAMGATAVTTIAADQSATAGVSKSNLTRHLNYAGEYDADAESVSLAGDKASLASALRKMEKWA